MSLNLDRSFFSVICDLGNCFYAAEHDLGDMSLARIIEDVRTGQLERVQAVMEFNPVEGWCNDVTDPVLAAAFPESATSLEPDWSDYRDERIDGRRAGISLRAAA